MLPRDTRTLRRSLHLIRKRKIFVHVRCNFYEKEKKNLVWHFMGPQLVRSYIADIEMLLKSLHIIFSTIKKNREKEGEMKTAYFGSCLILPVASTELPHEKPPFIFSKFYR